MQQHLKWITKFKNALFANKAEFYEEYLDCFGNKARMNQLIEKIQNHYQVKFNFDNNFLTFIKDYTFGFTAFKNNFLFLRKKILSNPKTKKPKVAKIKPYLKKHPKYLYGASKAAQKILWPGYKSKRSYNNKNIKPIKHSTKNILYKGLNFIKNKILRKI